MTYHTLAVVNEIHPQLVKKFDSTAHWKVNGKTPAAATYWPQSVDGFPESDPNFPAPAQTTLLPRIADFIYLKLAEPLKPGATVNVEGADGRKASFGFNPGSTVCWALKVNQVGYLPDAPQKFAYLGMWLGAAGAADFSRFEGQAFQLHAFEPGRNWRDGQAKGPPVFTGKIKLRAKEAGQKHKDQPITGEDVYELDWSAFQQPGRYCIVVPGLGRSWPFKIGAEVYGEVFYTAMKGLYIQRCGVELAAPFTQWPRKACHVTTYQGGFPPESDRWYDNDKYDAPGADGKAAFGFRDATGKPVRMNSFTAVGSTRTTKVIPGLKGGWHDAADYDRRVGHYDVVWDLCGVFEMFPAKFTDGQLNLPESGNGIPDLLDEAAVQVDLFRKTQTPAGGVSSWIEQNSHPRHAGTPDKDTNPFVMSLPERNASLDYAAAAAYLGRLMTPFNAARAKEYLESAKLAYAWGVDPKNTIRGVKFTTVASYYSGGKGGQPVQFDQKEQLPGINGGKPSRPHMLAAMQLFAATKEPRYLADWNAGNGANDVLIRGLPDAITPFTYVTPLLHPELFGQETVNRLQAAAEREAALFMQGQTELAYRLLWRPATHGYFGFMGWGATNAGRRARFPLLLWRVTGAEKYRQAALLGLDWELGCNEMGRSLVSGLGSTRPVVFQHIMSETDSLLEPYPGIAPYTFTYGVALPAWQYQFALVDGGHDSTKSFFSGAATCLLPASLGRDKIQGEFNAIARTGNWQKAMTDTLRPVIEPMYPIMRRLYTHPVASPPQNEFTINESISPLAACAAALLPAGWKPDEALKTRKPITQPQDLPFYLQP